MLLLSYVIKFIVGFTIYVKERSMLLFYSQSIV